MKRFAVWAALVLAGCGSGSAPTDKTSQFIATTSTAAVTTTTERQLTTTTTRATSTTAAPTTTQPVATVPPATQPTPDHPAGATAKCRDGTYSYSQSRSGTCSHHGGVAIWY
jgi:hypothetical protein